MEQVILVDEQDNAIGTMEKMAAHHTPVLHRAFSVFIFNNRKEMLLQQRAHGKYHSGGLWTNSCCSHPRPGEDVEQAAARRLLEEMGFATPLEKAFSFIYQATFDNGLTEYEFDHVFAGYYNGEVIPDPKEAAGFDWWPMKKIKEQLHTSPGFFTAWFRIAFPKIEAWCKQHLPGA
jgi:isopentenyl-diphosphate delta-isomerase